MMSVDMHEYRFRAELNKLPRFEPNEKRDLKVWRKDFPAWRALFSAMCLFGHSTGYRLPSYNEFFKYCKHAFTVRHPKKEKYAEFFEGELLPGMKQRISAWYESGMAETYLYVCLVDAFEDNAKSGLVLYDPRADWKLKADLIVIANQKPVLVSAFVGEKVGRSKIELDRSVIERDRKKNTMDSAHWDNAELAAMPKFEISRTGTELQIVNGVRVFAISAINRLVTEICDVTWAKASLFPLH